MQSSHKETLLLFKTNLMWKNNLSTEYRCSSVAPCVPAQLLFSWGALPQPIAAVTQLAGTSMVTTELCLNRGKKLDEIYDTFFLSMTFLTLLH